MAVKAAEMANLNVNPEVFMRTLEERGPDGVRLKLKQGGWNQEETKMAEIYLHVTDARAKKEAAAKNEGYTRRSVESAEISAKAAVGSAKHSEEANRIAEEANRISRQSRLISVLALVVSAAAFVNLFFSG